MGIAGYRLVSYVLAKRPAGRGGRTTHPINLVRNLLGLALALLKVGRTPIQLSRVGGFVE